ncbi:pseudaminic acid cytidylyltransferase [Fluoribacter gormanii]|uniref:pseudaminic acid cytidylyltransferase n=1 Tax=Fluoribacter gormanii TaxID=464 RepID=UPI001041A4FB|nr:pseudaminic acid cytidylyltransferase [Fluoribacter gormanii]
MNIAIIPARGGSKRIPRKNIKNFHGKPIIAYSIEAALRTNLFDKIMVSTDDQEIAAIANQYGAETPFIRPLEIADDYATTLDVIEHALNWLDSNDYYPKHLCCIYPTAPFLQKEYLEESYKLLTHDVHYVFAATEYAYPVTRAFKLTENRTIQMLWPENYEQRSQDLDKIYHDAGMFYWGTYDAFKKKLPIFSQHSTPLLLPHYRVHDIDTLDDWVMAEIHYKMLLEM